MDFVLPITIDFTSNHFTYIEFIKQKPINTWQALYLVPIYSLPPQNTLIISKKNDILKNLDFCTAFTQNSSIVLNKTKLPLIFSIKKCSIQTNVEINSIFVSFSSAHFMDNI